MVLQQIKDASPPAELSAAKRSATRTQERILSAAEIEFCQNGLMGARMDKIAKRSRSNMRMIYHYFGSKEKLYLACLERIYIRIRTEEERLDLKNLSPVEGMSRLIEFTFDHLLKNPEFVYLVMNENLLRGRYLKKSKRVPALTLPLVDALEDLLVRGADAGEFRKDVDPVHLYTTILAVSNIHISNRYTLSTMFQMNLADPDWLKERQEHARDVILGYLRPVQDSGRSSAKRT